MAKAFHARPHTSSVLDLGSLRYDRSWSLRGMRYDCMVIDVLCVRKSNVNVGFLRGVSGQ